jgi:hypothetical protein
MVAIAVRALYSRQGPAMTPFSFPSSTLSYSRETARAFAAGRPTSPDDRVFHGVGHPAILGILYTAFGASVRAAKAV